MNNKIQIGNHVKAEIFDCIKQYGIVAKISHDEFITLHIHNDLSITGIWRYNQNECTKITPQEYFKQILQGN